MMVLSSRTSRHSFGFMAAVRCDEGALMGDVQRLNVHARADVGDSRGRRHRVVTAVGTFGCAMVRAPADFTPTTPGTRASFLIRTEAARSRKCAARRTHSQLG